MGILHFLSIFLILAMKLSVSPALSYCHRESFQHPQKREEKETEAEREGVGGRERRRERERSLNGMGFSTAETGLKSY